MWDVHVAFGMTGGRLCYARYYLQAWLPDGCLIDIKSELLQQDADPFSVGIGQLRERSRVYTHVSNAATIEEHEHALDVRLDCLTKLGGCKDPCEVFPVAWIDYQREAQVNGWPFPPQHYVAGCTLPSRFHAQPVSFK